MTSRSSTEGTSKLRRRSVMSRAGGQCKVCGRGPARAPARASARLRRRARVRNRVVAQLFTALLPVTTVVRARAPSREDHVALARNNADWCRLVSWRSFPRRPPACGPSHRGEFKAAPGPAKFSTGVRNLQRSPCVRLPAPTHKDGLCRHAGGVALATSAGDVLAM